MIGSIIDELQICRGGTIDIGCRHWQWTKGPRTASMSTLQMVGCGFLFGFNHTGEICDGGKNESCIPMSKTSTVVFDWAMAVATRPAVMTPVMSFISFVFLLSVSGRSLTSSALPPDSRQPYIARKAFFQIKSASSFIALNAQELVIMDFIPPRKMKR